MPNSSCSFTLAGFSYKKKFSAVRRQAGLRFPLTRVNVRASILRFGPAAVRAEKRKINITGPVALFSLAGGKSHHFLVASYTDCSFIPHGVESAGERKGLGPGAL